MVLEKMRAVVCTGTVSILRLDFYPKRDNPVPVSLGAADEQSLSCETHDDGIILALPYQYEIGG